ncbi:ABC transporter permease subunit [Nesterenkonia salmonea]|uniref:ABC transporter permease subunit n=1 Tax=Nesterenkonia salmonea TaxID=1804987 RepID=A0A5R9BLR4_9MICC|nr:ABC transporter permease subunit [Nesterenkonia salmonea]TLQ01090.1 ABC transporter permease subunit [Nesterenkonia salmonea]
MGKQLTDSPVVGPGTLSARRLTTGRVLAPVLVGVLGLLLWQLLVGVFGISSYLLPAPTAIFAEANRAFEHIWSAALITGWNSLAGLVAGTLLGVFFAALAAASKSANAMVNPLVAALAVIPIVALAPILNTMFGSTQFPRQAIAALASFVPVFVSTLRGLRQTNPELRDLMHTYAATPIQIFFTITLPTAVPYVFTGVRLASSLAVISALVAEYFGGPRGGLGGIISTAAASSQYPRAWAYVLASIVLGLMFYLTTLLLEWLANRSRRAAAG